jgi:hypothetical protein
MSVDEKNGHGRTYSERFGVLSNRHSDDWRGHVIEVYVKNVPVQAEDQACIRIRAPEQADMLARSPKLPLVPDERPKCAMHDDDTCAASGLLTSTKPWRRP